MRSLKRLDGGILLTFGIFVILLLVALAFSKPWESNKNDATYCYLIQTSSPQQTWCLETSSKIHVNVANTHNRGGDVLWIPDAINLVDDAPVTETYAIKVTGTLTFRQVSKQTALVVADELRKERKEKTD